MTLYGARAHLFFDNLQRGEEREGGKWKLRGPPGEDKRRECFDSAVEAKRRGGTPLPQWQRIQNNTRAARFAGCQAAVLRRRPGPDRTTAVTPGDA